MQVEIGENGSGESALSGTMLLSDICEKL